MRLSPRYRPTSIEASEPDAPRFLRCAIQRYTGAQANGIAPTGRGSSLLAVMDPRSLKLLAIIEAT